MFKTGDKVRHRDGRKGVVTSIDTSKTWAVSVKFEDGTRNSYYANGKLYTADPEASIKVIPLVPEHITHIEGAGMIVTLPNGIQIYESSKGIPIQLSNPPPKF